MKYRIKTDQQGKRVVDKAVAEVCNNMMLSSSNFIEALYSAYKRFDHILIVNYFNSNLTLFGILNLVPIKKGDKLKKSRITSWYNNGPFLYNVIFYRHCKELQNQNNFTDIICTFAILRHLSDNYLYDVSQTFI